MDKSVDTLLLMVLGYSTARVIIVSALGPHFGLGLGLGPGLDN